MKSKEIQLFNQNLDIIIKIKTDLDEITTYIQENSALKTITQVSKDSEISRIPNKNVTDINKLIGDI